MQAAVGRGGGGLRSLPRWSPPAAARIGRLRVRELRAAQGSPPELQVSVFRFTLGIPGFDDSNLPALAGLLFGGLLVANHVASADFVSDAQWRTEVVGLGLAGVAVALPSLGRRLDGPEAASGKGATSGQRQLFVLAGTLSDEQKLELAWGSYALLQNSRTAALFVFAGGKVVCARGCWDIPDSVQGEEVLLLLDKTVKQSSIPSVTAPVCISDRPETQEWGKLSTPCRTLLVEPFHDGSGGFLVALSHSFRAYSGKDRAWIAALGRKICDGLARNA